MNERYLGCVTQFAWVAPCHNAFCGFVKDDAVISHEKNARELMGYDDKLMRKDGEQSGVQAVCRKCLVDLRMALWHI